MQISDEIQSADNELDEKDNSKTEGASVNYILENNENNDVGKDNIKNENNNDNNENNTDNSDCDILQGLGIDQDDFKDFTHSLEEEALQHEADKVSEKTDGFTGKIKEEICIDNVGKMLSNIAIDDVEDSSDESSDEDTAVEYMPDGELVRKTSRGFKQLSNCKRFWKASLMVE